MCSIGTIAIWGVGLIGGSLGMAWRQKAGLAGRVLGIGRSAPALEEAVRLGAIDQFTTDPSTALAEADVLVLAAPVGAIIEQAAEWGRHVRPGMVVTDVGSTKAAIVAAWEQHLPEGAAFVGGHPMFGREVGGVANASADLPHGCRWVITPSERSTLQAIGIVEHLAFTAGATVVTMDPAEHDRRVAFASHLPQLAASALAAAVGEAEPAALALAAGGFRDTTRLAASPADLWLDILATNPAPVRQALDAYRHQLDELAGAIDRNDFAAVRRIFAQAQAARQASLGR